MTYSRLTPRANPRKLETKIKLVAFSLQDLWLALKIHEVQRVIPMPQVFKSGQGAVGVASLDRKTVTILDLGQQLFGTPLAVPGNYLMLLPEAGGELIGIPVVETPMILEVSEKEIQALPPSYRLADTLGIASHLVVLSDPDQTVFLLDTARLGA